MVARGDSEPGTETHPAASVLSGTDRLSGIQRRRARGGDAPCAGGETISPDDVRPRRPEGRQGAESPERLATPSCGDVEPVGGAKLRSAGIPGGICPGGEEAHGRRDREAGSIACRMETSGGRIPGKHRPASRLIAESEVTNCCGGERPGSRVDRAQRLLRQHAVRFRNDRRAGGHREVVRLSRTGEASKGEAQERPSSET